MINTGVVERWLRKQTLLEAFLNVPVGLICLTASLVALALVTGVALVVGFILSLIIGAFVNSMVELDDTFPLFFSATFSAAFLLWLFISHYRRSAAYLRFSKSRKPHVHVFEAGLGRALNALLSRHEEDGIFKSIIYTGPQWFVSAISMFYKSVSLLGMEIKSCARILIILFEKGSRVSLTELAKLLPECNAPKVFPQLRNIAGVIFLETEPTGISITSDLRAELARVLGVKMKPQPEPRYYRQTRSAPPPPRNPPKPVVEEEPAGPHTILGVSRSASLAEIKAAYRKQIKLCHPDKFATLNKDWQQMADQRAKAVNAAYALLLDQLENRPTRA